MAQDPAPAADQADIIPEKYKDTSGQRLKGAVYWIAMLLGGMGIAIAINQTFGINPFGFILIDNSYYYILIAIFLSLAFLIFPAVKRHSHKVPLYDWALFFITIATAMYLSYHGGEMVEKGWDTVAPPLPTAVAAVMCFLALEGVRRAGGLILFGVCLVFFTFPLWTDRKSVV